MDSQAGADRLRRAFVAYEPSDKINLARNNDVDNSTVVYVGSSRNIGQRLQQHFHTCADGTDALKMNLWCPDADHRVRAEVSAVRGDIEASLIQDMEFEFHRFSGRLWA